jgi:hypothetical protein
MEGNSAKSKLFVTRHTSHQLQHDYALSVNTVLGLEEVNRLVPTVTDELGTCGSLPLSSFPALPSISARLVLPPYPSLSSSSYLCFVSCTGRGIHMATRVLNNSTCVDSQ